MKLEEGNTYKINLAALADRLGGIGAGSCRVKVVEYGLRGYDGRLTGDKTLHLVSDDELEQFICCDGEEVDFNGVDQWDCAQLVFSIVFLIKSSSSSSSLCFFINSFAIANSL